MNRPHDRLVNKLGVPISVWHEIEVAYQSGKDVLYYGHRYKVVAIRRILHTNGDTALAELRGILL